jgi:cell division protein FtsL
MMERESDREPASFFLRKKSPYLILFALILFTSFMGLGVLRLYSFRLEYKLNGINSQIDSLVAQNVALKESMSALLSPARVFDYSKKQLGMTFASNVRTLRLDGMLLADAAPVDGSTSSWRRRWRENDDFGA